MGYVLCIRTEINLNTSWCECLQKDYTQESIKLLCEKFADRFIYNCRFRPSVQRAIKDGIIIINWTVTDEVYADIEGIESGSCAVRIHGPMGVQFGRKEDE